MYKVILALAKLYFMPYISAWFHLVWSTKNRQPFLTEDIREKVFEHVRQYAKQKGIWLDQVNGHKDHVHCLLSLSCDQTLSKVLQLIKGESSYWINKEKLCKEKFAWQDEYFAMSLSQSHLQNVRTYIRNQAIRHRLKTYKEEVETFQKQYGFGEEG
jgi:REP element-mobilizing transposase RayT